MSPYCASFLCCYYLINNLSCHEEAICKLQVAEFLSEQLYDAFGVDCMDVLHLVSDWFSASFEAISDRRLLDFIYVGLVYVVLHITLAIHVGVAFFFGCKLFQLF